MGQYCRLKSDLMANIYHFDWSTSPPSLVIPSVAVASDPLRGGHLGGLDAGGEDGVVLLADRALPRLHVRHVVETSRRLRSAM